MQLQSRAAKLLHRTVRSAGVPSEKSSPRKEKGKVTRATPRHIVFVDNEDQAKSYIGPSKNQVVTNIQEELASGDENDSEGWSDQDMDEDESEGGQDQYAPQRAQKQELKRQAAAKKRRLSLLHELSARIKRDTVLRHTLRELELQKRLMTPGARYKIRGPERIEDEDEDSGSKKKRGEVKFARQGDIDYTPRV